MESCKKCIYSGNCYQESCYMQMKSVCKDFKEKNIQENRRNFIMTGNIFYVATKKDPIMGLYAVTDSIPASNNLVGFVSQFETFNICKTLKEANSIAIEWNKTYKENGKQF